MFIKEVSAKKIKDSRKNNTIEVSVNGCKASSPSGKSVGKYETPCYYRSLENSIKLINNLKELKNLRIRSFSDLDKVEGIIKKKFKFKDAKKFGANALFALESSILKALAKSEAAELWEVVNPDLKKNKAKFPIPVGNAIGGGLHSHKKNHPIIQEFLLIPNESSFSDNVRAMQITYDALGMILSSKKKNDEGAWETSLLDEQILSLLENFSKKTRLGIDQASSSLYKDSKYNYGKVRYSRNQQILYINSLIGKHNIFYVEDPLMEEDFQGFSQILKHNNSSLIVGDDLTVSHIDRLKKAIKTKAINAIIIKPNQNGSLLEIKKLFNFCKKKGIKTILSHRSGETLDNALADYAFAFQADYIKCGISTKFRESKLNRLIEIESFLKICFVRIGQILKLE